MMYIDRRVFCVSLQIIFISYCLLINENMTCHIKSLSIVFTKSLDETSFPLSCCIAILISRGNGMSSFICSSNLLRVEAMKIEVRSEEDTAVWRLSSLH